MAHDVFISYASRTRSPQTPSAPGLEQRGSAAGSRRATSCPACRGPSRSSTPSKAQRDAADLQRGLQQVGAGPARGGAGRPQGRAARPGPHPERHADADDGVFHQLAPLVRRHSAADRAASRTSRAGHQARTWPAAAATATWSQTTTAAASKPGVAPSGDSPAPAAPPAPPPGPPAAPAQDEPLVVGNYELDQQCLPPGALAASSTPGQHRLLGSPVAVRVYRPTEKDNKDAIRAQVPARGPRPAGAVTRTSFTSATSARRAT